MELALAIGFLFAPLAHPSMSHKNRAVRERRVWIAAGVWTGCAGIAFLVRGYDRVWNLQLPNLTVPTWLYTLALVLLGLTALFAFALSQLVRASSEMARSTKRYACAPPAEWSLSPTTLGHILYALGVQVVLVGFAFQVLCEAFGLVGGILALLGGTYVATLLTSVRDQKEGSGPHPPIGQTLLKSALSLSRVAVPGILFVEEGNLAFSMALWVVIMMITQPLGEMFMMNAEFGCSLSKGRPGPKPTGVPPPGHR